MSKYLAVDKQVPVILLSGVDADMLKDAEVGKPCVPFLIEKEFAGDAAEVHIYDANVPAAMKILDVSCLVTTAGAAAAAITATLDDGTDAITDAMAVNTAGTAVAVNTIVRATKIDATKATLAAGDSLDLTLSATTNAPAGVVRITAVWV